MQGWKLWKNSAYPMENFRKDLDYGGGHNNRRKGDIHEFYAKIMTFGSIFML